MNGLKETLKHYRNEDKRAKRELDIDEEGRLVIDVQLEKPGQAYSEFSPAKDPRMNPSLYEYILKENAFTTHPIVFRVTNDTLSEDAEKQTALQGMMTETFRSERAKLYSKLTVCKIKGLVFLLVGLAILAFSIGLQLSSVLNGLLLSSVEILAWVFVWEAADSYILERPIIQREYYFMTKLGEADYIFLKKEL